MKWRQADWGWQRHRPWIVDTMTVISVITMKKLHYFMAKIKNRQSSGHVLLKSTWRDDCWLANWRIIISDIQNGGIGGLGGRKWSWPKSPLSLLDSLLFSSPTLRGVFPLTLEFSGRELWAGPPNDTTNVITIDALLTVSQQWANGLKNHPSSSVRFYVTIKSFVINTFA